MHRRTGVAMQTCLQMDASGRMYRAYALQRDGAKRNQAGAWRKVVLRRQIYGIYADHAYPYGTDKNQKKACYRQKGS